MPATSGAGWPEPPPAGIWAAGPVDLAGKGGELAEVLARVPTGRLIVLGEPGSGKTMLMVRIVLDLLARRAGSGPVPILASIASWNPADQDLRGWLAAQLIIDYPALADPSPAGRTEATRAEALLAAGLILPVLDGLDEIPEQVWGPAISRINDALRPGERVVATCRTQQYEDAIRPPGGIDVTLRGAAAVQLRALDADVVRGYLCDAAVGPVMKARWAPVLAILGTEAPTAQALSTPLMVGLACAIYNPRPGEPAGILRDPAELCDPALANRADVESLLYDAFIPAAYRDVTAERWTAEQAETWLVFLSRHLEQTIRSPDLAWWRLDGLAVVSKESTESIAPKAPELDMKISPRGLAADLGFGLKLGLAVGIVLGFAAGLATRHVGGMVFGLTTGLWFGLGFALFGALLNGFGGERGDLARVTSPGAVLARDRQVALLLSLAGIVFGLVLGLPTVLLVRLAGELLLPVSAGHVRWIGIGLGVGLVVGLGSGFTYSAVQTAWPSYMLIRGSLALRRLLPWSLMSFLADAQRRGVLRQAGAVYQFRHIELQHRLANRDADKQQENVSVAAPAAGDGATG